MAAGKLYLVLTLIYLAVEVNSFDSQATLDTRKVTDGTELLFTFLVHRHGDRTPVQDMIELVGSDYFAKIEDKIRPWGYGQLTNTGKRTSYELGKFIRRRYNSLISPVYNTSEIYIRSTDSTRSKMTVLTAMAAVYPPTGDTWSEDVNWVPVPYTTVPARYDFNMAILNCPQFSSVYQLLMLTPKPFSEHAAMMKKLGDIFDSSVFSLIPGLSYPMYDLFVSELSLGVDLDEDIRAIMPELKIAADATMIDVFGKEKYLSAQAGVLLNEFFTYAAKIVSGENTPKLRVYSAHDVNVFAFAAISKVTPSIGVPAYGSVMALELRRVVETGKIIVLPVYLPSPHDSEVYLEVQDCGPVCELDSFISITSQFARNETAWREECGYSDDLDIDTHLID